ncbi:MAG TPA: hypothetical protein ENK91_03055, partial [Bacteroidetes bacterium]|nr:hypothetical protein [Bacteroidota bacterium]
MKKTFYLSAIILFIFISLSYNSRGQGVTIVDDITQGQAGTFNDWSESGVMARIGNLIYLYDLENYPYSLWVVNTTNYEAQLIGKYKGIYENIEYGGKLYVSVREGSKKKLIAIAQDNSVQEISSSTDTKRFLTVFNNELYFADDDVLKKYNDTSNEVTDVYEFYWFAGIRDMTATDNNLFIIGGIEEGTALFTSDGTNGGTHNYYTINTGNEFNSKIYMTPVGDKVFFFYDENGEGYKLWVTDGTANRAFALKSHEVLSFDNLNKNKNIIAYNGKFYYRGDGAEGDNLYVSDGTVS